MRLKTIWTLPGMALSERLHRTKDAAWRSLATHLPTPLAYWSYIHTGVRAIRHNDVVPDVTYMEILERMAKGYKK